MATSLGSLTLLVLTLAACSNSSDGSGNSLDSGRTGDRGGNASTSNGTDSGGTSVLAGRSPGKGGVTTSTGGSNHGTGGVTTSTGGSNHGTGGATTGPADTTPSAIDCRKEGDGKTTLVFVNGCTKPVTYRGSDIAGGTLAPGASACVDVGTSTEAISSKRYWGYAGADPGAEHHTLAEFTFNTDFYDLDWYNISHVDAHNLPMAILPSARPTCRQMICPQDFLSTCPTEGQYRDAEGNVVSCVSPNRDDPNGVIVKLFEQCDDAYAWSGDDQNGTDISPMIGCEVEDFDIVFCPEAP